METFHKPSHVFIHTLAPCFLLLLHVEVEVTKSLSVTPMHCFLRQIDEWLRVLHEASVVSPYLNIWTTSFHLEECPRIYAIYT